MTIRRKIVFQIAIPIILVGLFVIVVFTSLYYENLTIEIYAIFTLVAIFVFFFGFAIGQRFTSPVKELLEKAEQLSKGELGSRIYLETKDEFEELSKAFNKIAEELQESHTATKKAEDFADLRIRAKTKELEETIGVLEQKVKNRAAEVQKIITESESLQGLFKNRETEIIKLKKELKELKDSEERKSASNKK